MKKNSLIIFLLNLIFLFQPVFGEGDGPNSLAEIDMKEIQLFGVAAGVLTAYANDVEDQNAAYTQLLLPNDEDAKRFLEAMDLFMPYIIQFEDLLRAQGASEKANSFKLAWLHGSGTYVEQYQQHAANMSMPVVDVLNSLSEEAGTAVDQFVQEYNHLFIAARAASNGAKADSSETSHN